MKEKLIFISKLIEVKNELIGSGHYREAVETLEGLDIISVINALVYNKVDNSKDNIDMMRLLIECLNAIYNNSGIQSPIQDDLYDKLYERFKSDTKGEEVIGAPVSNMEDVKTHRYPNLRGTLIKTHFITDEEKGNDNRKSIEAWIRSIENKLGYKINPEIEIDIKWDGVSGVFDCNNEGYILDALTRGYTKDNTAKSLKKFFNKSTNFKHLVPNEYKGDFGVKTEIVITDNAYKEACKYYDFSNKRSCVSGILGTKEPDPRLTELLTIIPLRIELLEDGTVMKPEYAYDKYPFGMSKLKDFKRIRMIIDYLKECADLMGIDADGVVIKITDEKICDVLGREDSINQFEVAYKFPPQEKKTIIKRIDFQIGTLGNISPVGKLETVKMKGNKISNVSLGSIDRFEDLGLAEGDEVIIKYDVIPYLYVDETCMRSGNDPIPTPRRCPVCGELLRRDPQLKCVNMDCDARVIGKIVNFLNKRNILNVSEATITTLVNTGFIKTISDLYNLKNCKLQLAEIPGFGETSVSVIVDAIEGSKEMYDYEFLGSLGIESIGERVFKKILEIYTMEELIDLIINGKGYKLEDIKGIKTATVIKINNGIISNLKLINELIDKLSIKRLESKDAIKVCFTKVRDYDFEKFLKENDVVIENNFNRSINYLIVEDYSVTSGKVDKAKRANIEVLSLVDAYDKFNYK